MYTKYESVAGVSSVGFCFISDFIKILHKFSFLLQYSASLGLGGQGGNRHPRFFATATLLKAAELKDSTILKAIEPLH